ncbi:hypothetical protein GCM10007852_27430 [Agaribacter marinus]|uniref:Uncharacterized protein n=1 Tax=Agaribacter marinus TaxID=1431249 RepID=A0AA37T167_9ALTE|nr:hypothetical protein GCM10007852_27430 [Agaribacter marinus]
MVALCLSLILLQTYKITINTKVSIKRHVVPKPHRNRDKRENNKTNPYGLVLIDLTYYLDNF